MSHFLSDAVRTETSRRWAEARGLSAALGAEPTEDDEPEDIDATPVHVETGEPVA